jgi:hypothetical protein
VSVYGYTFGRVPDGLLFSDASDRACRLFAVLTRWADQRAGEHPTRKELATDLRCSVDSIDRARDELVYGGWLKIEPRFVDGTAIRDANDWLLQDGPEGRTGAAWGSRNHAATTTSANAEPAGEGGRSPAARGGRTGAATIEPERPSKASRSPGGKRTGAAGKPPHLRVADHPEAERLCTLLADLIEVNTGRRPNPDQQRWRDAVRLMITEDDLSVEQVQYLIRWSQANEFWRSNILSTPKLREKQLTLIAQIQRERAAAYGSRQASHDASVAELLVGTTTGGSP